MKLLGLAYEKTWRVEVVLQSLRSQPTCSLHFRDRRRGNAEERRREEITTPSLDNVNLSDLFE
jgi:hypothetical protein